ncbi:MAG: hypothetical protein KC643_13090, partial [Nitrospira sp.]|nr:hypothetical protein [Nitrospira sp.]
SFLQEKFELTPGKNFFEFPYDWRLDNRIAAKQLESKSHDWLRKWKSFSGNPEAKLVFVAHSMGGLVTRYFLEVLEGWKITSKLLTLGTPYCGSIKALNFLCNGLKKSIGPIELINLSQLLRSFPSVYQLLPTYNCVGPSELDLQKLEDMNTLPGLSPIEMQYVKEGIGFHAEIHEWVNKNHELEDYQNEKYTIHPFVGTYQPTLQSALLQNTKLVPLQSYRGKDLAGDGTVPRFSAMPSEWKDSSRSLAASCPHVSLQNFPSIQVQIRSIIDELDLEAFRGVPPDSLKLEMDDMFAEGEPIRIKVFSKEGQELKANLTNLTSQKEWTIPTLEKNSDGWQTQELPNLQAGAYRITLKGLEEGSGISDLFLVIKA